MRIVPAHGLDHLRRARAPSESDQLLGSGCVSRNPLRALRYELFIIETGKVKLSRAGVPLSTFSTGAL